MTRLSFFPLLLTGLIAAGCSDSGGSAAPSGQTLYEQRHADGNTFACATCHALEEPALEIVALADQTVVVEGLENRHLQLVLVPGLEDEAVDRPFAHGVQHGRDVGFARQDHAHDPSGTWRGVKRDGWEGGHRVPFIARWPGRIPSGQVSGQMTNTTTPMKAILWYFYRDMAISYQD